MPVRLCVDRSYKIKEECKKKGLSQAGSKDELIARIVEFRKDPVAASKV